MKLLDFGLARGGVAMQDALTIDLIGVTNAGNVLGTVSYMSPEQARREELDARSDMFSLGVVLYEMTTGRPAFPGKTTAVIIDRLLNHPVDPPTRSSPGLPKDLDKLISQLLTKNRDQRPTTARELGPSFRKLRDSAANPPAQTSEKKSIAVLPFENRSADPDNEYFSDGLTDEITHLSMSANGRSTGSRTPSVGVLPLPLCGETQLDIPETGQRTAIPRTAQDNEDSLRRVRTLIRGFGFW